MKETTAESYAIIQTGGKQYQAVAGKTIAIEKLNIEAGENVTFNEVLLRKTMGADSKEVIEVGQPFVKTPVTATIVKHIRGPKIIVFHFKRRKKYKRKTGHRQPYTIVRITAI